MQIVDESDQPGAFLISCGKCLRSHEIHGTAAKLEQALLAEGWLEESGKMVCPNCPAPRELPNYNKTKEIARRARRESVRQEIPSLPGVVESPAPLAGEISISQVGA